MIFDRSSILISQYTHRKPNVNAFETKFSFTTYITCADTEIEMSFLCAMFVLCCSYFLSAFSHSCHYICLCQIQTQHFQSILRPVCRSALPIAVNYKHQRIVVASISFFSEISRLQLRCKSLNKWCSWRNMSKCGLKIVPIETIR